MDYSLGVDPDVVFSYNIVPTIQNYLCYIKNGNFIKESLSVKYQTVCACIKGFREGNTHRNLVLFNTF